MRRLARMVAATGVLFALIAGSAPVTPAMPETDGAQAVSVAQTAESVPLEAAPGSLFHQVEQREKVRLLEEDGFTPTARVDDGLTYEKTEGGITIGYQVSAPVVHGEGKMSRTDARVGWDGVGPYVAATRGGECFALRGLGGNAMTLFPKPGGC